MKDFTAGSLRYKDLKDVTADALVELIAPFRQRKAELLKDEGYIEKLANQLSEKARSYASDTLEKVRKLTGLPSYL